jgi:invasion protein IalB
MAMKKIIGFGIFVLMAQTAFAQDAAPPEKPTKETATLGQIYVESESAPWETRCTKTDRAADPCQLFQLLRDADGGPVAEVNFFAVPAGSEAAAGAAFVAPLETSLPSGVIIQVDSNEAKVYPFSFCNSYGCVARIGFTADELANLKSGNKAIFQIVPAAAPDAVVRLSMSLAGFTAGFDAVAATISQP